MQRTARACHSLATFSHVLRRGQHTDARVIFSGIQPTGTPHLGNYLGALSNWFHLQRTAGPSDQLIYSIVGLHAITVPQDPAQLRRDRLDALASLLAIGIDPTRSILYHQDEVQEHAELAWILGCNAPIGRLSRMTAYKSKLVSLESASNDEKLGLFAYPVLQAADILLYKATHVPVGEDQRQHLELTRDVAQVFNQRFAPSTFPLPATISTPAKRVLSLRDPTQKMSKSASNPKSRIVLSDSMDEINMKIRKAVTDSDTHISYDPIQRPGISNLLRILHECNRLKAAASSSSPPNTFTSSTTSPSPSSYSSNIEDLPPSHTQLSTGQSSESVTAGPQRSSTTQLENQHIGQQHGGSSSRLSTSSLPLEVSSQSEQELELHELAASFARDNVQTPKFKEAVANAVEACIAPIRADFVRHRRDEGYLREVAAEGARKAREIAQKTMSEVKTKIGLS